MLLFERKGFVAGEMKIFDRKELEVPLVKPKRNAFGKKMKDKDGNTLYVEVSSGPFFCQDTEQQMDFEENNPDIRTENFTVQVRKRTAIKYIDAPDNMKQFERKV